MSTPATPTPDALAKLREEIAQNLQGRVDAFYAYAQKGLQTDIDRLLAASDAQWRQRVEETGAIAALQKAESDAEARAQYLFDCERDRESDEMEVVRMQHEKAINALRALMPQPGTAPSAPTADGVGGAKT
jgi:hypothetical protein